jgi:hypothetical protein
MKRIILFLILITQFAFAQVNTTTTTVGKLKMNVPDPGAKKDSVVVWDGTTKLLKFRPASQITGTTNLDQLVSPTGISIFSSTGTDIVLPLATSTNSGLFAPAEKTKLAGIASGATANDTDANLKNRANHTGTQAIATVTGLQTALDGKENLSSKGISNGYAGLDASGKVPLTQINDALIGSVNYQGTYNAATNTPALPTISTSNKGFYYVVSAAGTQAGLTLSPGDWIISNGTAWGKIDNNNAVTAVNGATGNVTLSTSNIAEGTNLYYTDARVNANASVAASAASRHNALTLGAANGLSLSTQALSLGLASTSTTGALSSTDWNTFNNKANANGSNASGTWSIDITGKATELRNNSIATGDANTVFKAGAYSLFNTANVPFTGDGGMFSIPSWASTNASDRYNLQIVGQLNTDKFWMRSTAGNGSGVFRELWHNGNFNPNNYLLLSGGTLSGQVLVNGSGSFGKQDYSFQSIQRVLTLRGDGVSGAYPLSSYRLYTSPGQLNPAQKLSIRAEAGGVESSDIFSLLGDGSLLISGSITAPAFFQSSDRRLKTILKRDGDVAYFKWKDKRDTKTHIGYIAQEVRKNYPHQVQQDEKGLLSVNYIEVLVAKVQKLEKRIQELEQKK